jgi:hypothetical protein
LKDNANLAVRQIRYDPFFFSTPHVKH